MTRVEELERAVENLLPEELAEFRRWFADFDNAIWDARIEHDARAGHLDRHAREARAAYDRGDIREL